MTGVDPTGGWAEPTQTGLQASREFGHFVSPAMQELVGMLQDHLKVVRFERQLRLADRVRAAMKKRGMSHATRLLPINTLLPLLEAATLEENDDLQDTWAEMLVNAGDAASGAEMRRAYVTMLADMTALDVKVLSAIHAAPAKPFQGVLTAELPDRAVPMKTGDKVTAMPPFEVAVSLGNLTRLGCIMPSSTVRGNNSCAIVYLSDLGNAFIKACTEPRP